MDFDSLLKEAESARQSGDWEKARACLRACMDKFPDRQVAGWYAKLGEACVALGRLDEAGAAYAHARKRWPNDSRNWVGAARLLASAKNWEEAACLWQTCIERFPAKANVQWYRARAQALLGLDRLSESAAVYAAATKVWPESPIGWLGLARTASRQHDWPRSVERWQDCIARFNDIAEPEWYAELSRCVLQLGVREGDLQSATIFAVKAIALTAIRPGNLDKLSEKQRLPLARVLTLAGRPEKARLVYDRKPQGVPDCHANLALIVEPGLRVSNVTRHFGHHLNATLYSWKIIEQLIREGADFSPVVLSRETVEFNPLFSGLSVVPALTLEPNVYGNLPCLHRHLKDVNDCFYHDLSLLKLDGRMGLVIVNSMRPVMIDGFSRWIEDIFRTSTGLVVVGFIEVIPSTADAEIIANYAQLYSEALNRLVNNSKVKLLLYVETEAGRTFLESLGIPGLEVKTYPYLAASLCLDHVSQRIDAPARAICLGTLGETRREKGSQFFPALIAKTQDLANRCEWQLQLALQPLRTILGTEDLPFVDSLHRFANTTIVEEPLSSRAYFEFLDRLDVVILPYSERYAMNGSGIFHESIYMRKYLLVPRNSYMPQELARLNHPHRVMEELTPFCIEQNVRWIIANQDAIKCELAAIKSRPVERLPSEKFYVCLRDKARSIGMFVKPPS